jgi:hypothetical protein
VYAGKNILIFRRKLQPSASELKRNLTTIEANVKFDIFQTFLYILINVFLIFESLATTSTKAKNLNVNIQTQRSH